MRHLILCLLSGLIGLAITAAARAENVDLSTVPNRDTVQLTIYNSEDITLVRETRKISFKKGGNPLQFSWANTLIDPTSVELRFLTDPDKLEVLDTTFPHAKPQMLYWNVESELDGEATIEITYFTSGISWTADYVLVADQDESQVGFEGFVRVHNNSGEEYEDAQVRLVVGKINLVEKIAKLAQVTVQTVGKLEGKVREELRRTVTRMALSDGFVGSDSGAKASSPKEIIKEGLSEYFIYTIEGTETIANGWSKRMRSLKPVDVPLKIQYRYREAEYGPQLVRMYLMRNDVASKLGTTPLPDGVVRVFRDNGRDGLSFLMTQTIKYVAIGDKIELNLGVDPEVIFELIKLRVWRDAIWMRVGGTNVYRRVDAPGVQIEVRSSVVGWDDHTIYTQRVRNYSSKPIDLEVRRSLDGHVTIRSQLTATNHDFRTMQYTAKVPARQQVDLLYEVVQHQGRNAKQNNVTLETAEVVAMKRLELQLVTLLVCCGGLVSQASAENVDLSTVPNRDTVQLTIYNSEDITLVRETRKISFKKGGNPLQFSWANTLIDPTSVELRFLTDPDKLEVLDTTFPHAKPQMLYWNVESEIDGEATIEITYFTSGISWTADYVLVANQDESQVGFEGFVRVHNNSGEEYEDAQIRLVVGKINLVEKMAQLARVTVEEAQEMDAKSREKFSGRVRRQIMGEGRSSGRASGPAAAPKEIIKEGLSEYFIYTIEGTETIANGWSKRMRSLKPVDVPLDIQYRYREAEYGPQLVRMYLMRNDVASKLGTTPLPDGVVRVFRDNGRDGLSFLMTQTIKYVAIGDKIELNLGVDPEVIFELIKLRVWRDAIWMRVGGTNVYRRVDAPGVQIEVRSSVVGWDDHTIYTQRVRNYSSKPIDLEVRRSLDGHVTIRSQLTATNHDFRTMQYTAKVPASQQVDLLYEVVQHQGRNAKQNNVTLETAEVAR